MMMMIILTNLLRICATPLEKREMTTGTPLSNFLNIFFFGEKFDVVCLKTFQVWHAWLGGDAILGFNPNGDSRIKNVVG